MTPWHPPASPGAWHITQVNSSWSLPGLPNNHLGIPLSWWKILTNLDTVSGIRESLDSLGNQECHLSIRSISNYIIFLLFNKAIIFYFTNIVMSICSDQIFDSNSDTHYTTDSDSDPNSDSAFSSGLDSDDIFITFLVLFLILFQFVILYLFLIQFIFL